MTKVPSQISATLAAKAKHGAWWSMAAAAFALPQMVMAQDAPVYNNGDIAWMLVSTAFVLLMSIPGLALFYGGMARAKNMLSTMMQIFTIFCVIAVLWVVYGYSMAFSNGSAFFGGLSKTLLSGVVYDANGFFVPT
ncbi:MAG: ammonia channel protein, partial [Pseudomonadota bacterium]